MSSGPKRPQVLEEFVERLKPLPFKTQSKRKVPQLRFVCFAQFASVGMTRLSGFLAHFGAHAEEFADRACGQAFHMIVEFGDSFEESGHG
jgi:hypothetical protein